MSQVRSLYFLILTAFFFTYGDCLSRSLQASEPLRANGHAQLFLDNRVVEEMFALKRTVHRPQMYKNNPVMSYEHPWEYSCVTLWGTVLFDEAENIFKCWYQTWGDIVPERKSIYICYATSIDGKKWDKPELGIHEFEGSKKNNIVYVPSDLWLDSPTVVKDLDEPDENKRYKMTVYESGPGHPPHTGIWHATSPDGIHFTRMKGPVIHAGDRNSFYRDPIRKKWVVVTRKAGVAERTIALSEADEFGIYQAQRLVFKKDDRDPLESDLYSMPTFHYEGMLIGCVEVYNHQTQREVTQLAWSYDGKSWQRDASRQPFMSWGEKPAWDWARRHPHNGPLIRRDGKLWLYFGGRSTLKMSTHPKRLIGAIGLSFLRIDGFCSLDANRLPAYLVSKPIVCDGESLTVNADIKPNGWMKVSVVNEQEEEIDGFGRVDSIRLVGDDVEHVAQWSGEKSLASLKGRTICLRFDYQDGDLYSFRIK